ncbi:hypothetical protein LLP99_17160 [Rouxiella badensis]|uniref:hypothetical protein n=1 Tax=Rouxiella badensis TaxID=1646377 RepID=UPI001D13EC43|nr:hypothetical protein [Rouxiella badensis]MCC3730043.1 hypothetical protein [Rouxiella badensis]
MYTSTKEIAVSEEKTEVALITLPTVPAELEAAFIDDKFIDDLIKSIRTKASSVVGDLDTVKGRKVYISMAADVRSTKVMIDAAGKDLVAEMKKRPAMVDASRRKVREALDDLAIEIRKPVTDWEAEQDRIAAEKAAEEERQRIEAEQAAAAEALKKQIEDGHELALLMNIQFDRDAADAQAEAERQRIAHEEEIKRQAAEQARIDAEENIKREREESAQREAALKLKAEQEEQAKIEVQQTAEREKKEAAEKVERDKKEAQERAEREKQEAIAEEQCKQQEAEQRRVAEEKRLKDEADKRAADVAHRKTIGTAVVNALTEHAGLTREQAIETLKALMDNKIPHTSIQY